MNVTYHTVAMYLPPTPLGLLGERWAIEHWCNTCRQRVSTDQLVTHTRSHDNPAPTTSFPSPSSENK